MHNVFRMCNREGNQIAGPLRRVLKTEQDSEAEEASRLINFDLKGSRIFTDLETLRARVDDFKPNTENLPVFLGKELRRSVNLKRFYVSDRFPNDYVIKCWDVPVLSDKLIAIDREADLKPVVAAQLAKLGIRLRGEWNDQIFSFHRYVHLSLQSELDSEYGLPYYLEYFGMAVDNNVTYKNGGTVTALRRTEDLSNRPFKLYVRAATWSNISFPGIGVSIYG